MRQWRAACTAEFSLMNSHPSRLALCESSTSRRTVIGFANPRNWVRGRILMSCAGKNGAPASSLTDARTAYTPPNRHSHRRAHARPWWPSHDCPTSRVTTHKNGSKYRVGLSKKFAPGSTYAWNQNAGPVSFGRRDTETAEFRGTAAAGAGA